MVNLTLTNGNAVLTITFAYIVVEQVTRQLSARKPQLPRRKLVPPKSRQRTRTTRKKLKQPSRLRTDSGLRFALLCTHGGNPTQRFRPLRPQFPPYSSVLRPHFSFRYYRPRRLRIYSLFCRLQLCSHSQYPIDFDSTHSTQIV